MPSLPSPLAGEGSGERGRCLLQHLKNPRQYRFWLAQNVIVPEAQYSKPLLFEPAISNGIPLATMVLTAIGLDDQPGAKMHEIHDIGADRLLTAELLSEQAVSAQMTPQHTLGIGHVLA